MTIRTRVLVVMMVLMVAGGALAKVRPEAPRRAYWVHGEKKMLDQTAALANETDISRELGGKGMALKVVKSKVYHNVAKYLIVELQSAPSSSKGSAGGLDEREVEEVFERFQEEWQELLTREFERDLDTAHEAGAKDLRQAEEHLDRSQGRMAELSMQRGRLAAESGVELSQEAILGRLADLHAEAREHEMELRTLHARREALEQAADRLRHKAEERVHRDGMLENLERQLRMREEALERRRERMEEWEEAFDEWEEAEHDEDGERHHEDDEDEDGHDEDDDGDEHHDRDRDEDEDEDEDWDDEEDEDWEEEWMMEGEELADEAVEAEEEVMAARMELHERREMLRETGGGGLLGELHEHMVEMHVEMAELEARLEGIRGQIHEIMERDLLGRAVRFEMISRELEFVRRDHRGRVELLQRARDNMVRLENREPPRVTVADD